MGGFNQEKFDKNQGGRRTYKLPEGDSQIRILPVSSEYFDEASDGVDAIAMSYKVHFKVPTAGGDRRVVCPKTFDPLSKCPVCELASAYYNQGDAAGKQMYNRIRAKERYLFNILLREHDSTTNDIQSRITVLETGPQIYKEVKYKVLDPDWCDKDHKKNGTLMDPEHGRTVKITKHPAPPSKSGEATYPSYTVSPHPSPSSVLDSMPEGWKTMIDELSTYMPPEMTADMIQAILAGVETPSIPDVDSDADGTSIEPTVSPTAPTEENTPECFGELEKYSKESVVCQECACRQVCIQKILGAQLE